MHDEWVGGSLHSTTTGPGAPLRHVVGFQRPLHHTLTRALASSHAHLHINHAIPVGIRRGNPLLHLASSEA